MLAVLIVLMWAAGLALGFETSVSLLTALGFITILIGLWSPGIGLLGIGLIATIDAVSRNFLLTGGLLRWNTLNYLLLFVLAINLPNFLRINELHTRLLQLFILLLAIETAVSPAPRNGLIDLINIAAAFGITIYFARGFKISGAMYWMAILSGLAAGVGGLIFYLQIESLPYVNPNSFALFPLSALFAICLGYISADEHRHGRLVLLFLAALNFLWIFLSGSRGNMLVALVTLLFLFLFTRKLSWKIAFIVAAWAALGVVAYQFSDLQSYAFSRISKFFDPTYSLNQRTSGRSDIAEAGWRLFLANPLGVGTGGFKDKIAEIGFLEEEIAAHSGWIKVLAENGIPGIILLTAYIVSFTLVGWRKRKNGLFLLGVLVSLSFGVALLSKEFEGKSLWLLAMGGAVLLHHEHMSAIFERKSRFDPLPATSRIIPERSLGRPMIDRALKRKRHE